MPSDRIAARRDRSSARPRVGWLSILRVARPPHTAVMSTRLRRLLDRTIPRETNNRVLLTVSGPIPPDLDAQVAAGSRPRADYRVLAEGFGADLCDETLALSRHRLVGRLLHRTVGTGALLAWACWRVRSNYDVIVTDGEQVGLPFALLCRLTGRAGGRHAMIVHVVSTPTKRMLVRWARLAPMIDRWIVYCTAQGGAIMHGFGVEPERVEQTPFMVDTDFFSPAAAAAASPVAELPPSAPDRAMICAVGLERRDYPTLMRAVGGLDVDVVVAAASPWSRQDDSTEGERIPSNVTVRAFSQAELREVYDRCAFSVMPLFDVDFQAGITAILESMSMARPVVCTRTPGQTDTIVDAGDPAADRQPATGVYVPPGDATALRATVTALLGDAVARDRLGRAAREWAVEHADVEVYARRLGAIVRDLRE